jgi:hypothetical protein
VHYGDTAASGPRQSEHVDDAFELAH